MPRVKPSLPSRLMDAAALADLLCVKQSWIYDQVQKRAIPYLRTTSASVLDSAPRAAVRTVAWGSSWEQET